MSGDSDKGLKQLRLDAEQILAQSENSFTHFNERQYEELIHELQVHQIELEMQNDELRRMQSHVLAAKEKYSNLYHHAPISYCYLDKHSVILDVNHAMSQLLGYPREKLVRAPLGRFVAQSDLLMFHQILKNEDEDQTLEIRFTHQQGQKLICQLQLRQTQQHGMNELRWMATLTDVTQLRSLAQELEIKGAAIDNTMEGVMITDAEGNICYVNPAFESITGYSREEAIGNNPRILNSGKHTQQFYQDMWTGLRHSGKWRGEIINRRASGQEYPELLSITTIYDRFKQPSFYVGIFSDITQEDSNRKQLHELAYFDGLTGLPNRRMFMNELHQELIASRKANEQFAVLFMDLDRFKSVNDTLGHSVGDQLLCEVSKRFKNLIRSTDTFARMGGDEFILLLPNIKHIKNAIAIAQKILNSIEAPFCLEQHDVYTGVSIGISCYPEDGEDVETLIKNADIAMYQAKSLGRNRYQVFNEELDTSLQHKIQLENDLRDALNRNEFELYYQPIWDLKKNQCSGVEALIRWNNPSQEIVPPDEFISVAEESGLIVNIGYWVIRTAAQQYKAWLQQGQEVELISVNLSPLQFSQRDLVERIQVILDETGVPPEKIGIEVTESAAMPNFENSLVILHALREMGVKIYIDDFGTGFSSLSVLRQMPIDVLKIDRQFIDDIPHKDDDVAIAQAIIAMAKTLNFRIIAEGVETQEQYRFLEAEGCDAIQGYLKSKPLTANELVGFCFQKDSK